MIPIAAAASVILFIGLNSFVFNNGEELTLDSLSENDLELWFDSNTLSTSEIALVLEDDLLEIMIFLFLQLKMKLLRIISIFY